MDSGEPEHARAKEIFLAALEIHSSEQRTIFVREQCGDAASLREEVEALLVHHGAVEGAFLESPAIALQPDPPCLDPPTFLTAAGTMIGRYKVLEPIGEGGYGTVFMAQQTSPVHRQVALKIVKAGMDTRQVIGRFEAERQALALMDHPNIAKVFDAGVTETGRPYFVMELVKGRPITTYCDDHKLTPQKRLELFVQVCHAVQHAHQKGIIHRDLKPTNVLVAQYDGRPVPKVIDFGVAKATGQQLTERTMFTGFGDVIGTPQYMSPEQAELNQFDIDTRSDIYSLGVLLYELLTGTTPLESKRVKEAALLEVLRVIREEEPPRPSTRLTTTAELPSIAAQRGVEPKKLSGIIRGELDWIVMKALEKERGRRYETATGLARDIERYLGDDPVEACPPSAAYRLRKFSRKHRAALLVATGFVALLALASIVSTWQAVRARRAEQQVVRQRDQVQTALVQKEASERTARQRLANQLIALGDAALASGRSPARDSYREAREVARALAVSELPATAALLASYAEQPPPLMGSDGRRGDIGGFEGHTSKPTLAFMADGRRAVSAAFDQSIVVWDVARATPLRRFSGAGSNVLDMALSPDGRWVLTAGGDKVQLRDVGTGEVLRTFTGHDGGVRGVAFSPDARWAISGGEDGTVRLWDTESGKELRRFNAPSHVHSVAFSPDGRSALSSGEPDAVVLWDLESGRAIHVMTEGTGSSVVTVAFSPDGRTALSGSLGHGMVLWDLKSGTAVRRFRGHAASIDIVRFSPDGRLALSGSADRTVRLWDVASGSQITVWLGHGAIVRSLCFSPDGRLALSSDISGAIKLWDLREQRETVEFRGHSARVISLCAAADGMTLLSGSFDKSARLWDVATGLPMVTLPTGQSLVWGVALAPDGRMALSAHADGTLALWDVHTGTRLRSLGKHKDIVTSVAFSSDGRSALSGSSDATLKLWNLDTGEALRTFTGHSNKVRAVAFSPDGRTALSASFDKTIKLWDLATGAMLRTFTDHRNWVHSVAFSPDGRWAASGGWDHRWGLWDVGTGKRVYFKQSAPDVVAGIAFSPDGKLLMTGHLEGSTGLWDLVNNVHVRDLQRHRRLDPIAATGATTMPAGAEISGVTSVLFCRDGVTMLAGSREGHVRRWQLDRPARYDEFARSLPRAREALARHPNDAAALAVFGRWYAFRGVHDWAAEFLEKARERGGDVRSLELARCYWQLDRPADAAREFDEAIRKNEAPRNYLELCRSAVTKPLRVEDSAATTGAQVDDHAVNRAP